MKEEVSVLAESRESSKTLPGKTGKKKLRAWYKNWQLYLLALPALAIIAVFCYAPMYGIIIAFKDYNVIQGIGGSPWADPIFKHFTEFVTDPYFLDMLWNTLRLSLCSLLVFPLPILFALLLNEIRVKSLRTTVQIISYAPYFISLVVSVSMCFTFLEYTQDRVGIINRMIMLFGLEPVKFMESAAWFPWIYVLSGMWQGLGWWSITYVAALTAIDPTLYEAAEIDGASRLRKIWHINIPGLLPIVSITLIMNLGNMLNVGFEKVLLMQTDLNYASSNIISTYVYEKTLGSVIKQYSYGTAIGLFNNIISLVLLLGANFTAKKLGGETIL